jgi:uncharacterized integral membrane protein
VSYSGSGDAPDRAAEAGRTAEPEAGSATHGERPAGTATPAPDPAATKVPHTRTAVAFNSMVAGAIVLILLLVFILENTQSVRIAYFGIGFHLPLGVALLLAAIGGALIVGIVGTARIVQLRRHVRRRGR